MLRPHSVFRLVSAAASVIALALVVALALGGEGPVQAAAIAVNTTADDTAINGNCTLREALAAALFDAATDACAAGSGADTITVPAGTYTLTGGDLNVDSDVTINGAGVGSTIIDGNADDRVFNVQAGSGAIDVAITGMTVRNGSDEVGGGIYADNVTLTLTDLLVTGNEALDGGGIRNGGTASLNNVTVSDNTASDEGGGIYSNYNGTTTLTDSTVTGNSAGSDGGGIMNEGPDTLTVIDSAVSGNTSGEDGGGIANQYEASAVIEGSTISDNTAAFHGGGIYNNLCCGGEVTITDSAISGNTTIDGGGIFHGDDSVPRGAGSALGVQLSGGLTVANSTISGNQAVNGGGILNVGAVSLTNVTVAENSAEGAPQVSAINAGEIEGGALVALGGALGGGIFNPDGEVAMVNTIVANNTPDDCLVAPISSGHNLDSDDSCELTGDGDQPGVDPLLAALALNAPGGTETHALPAESPAVDTGDDEACPATDQRGVDRPQDGDEGGAGTAVCDIGAYELVPDADGDGVLDAFDACVNDPEDFDGIEDTDGCPEAPAQPTATPAQLPETGGTPGATGSGWPYALLAAAIALVGAGGALVAVRRRR